MNSKTAWIERDRLHWIHPLHTNRSYETAHVWERGEGVWLVDCDGKRYLDGVSALWNVVLGHSCSELVEATTKQMETLPYCSGYSGSSNQAAIQLAETLAEVMYPQINRFYFTSGGAEATDSSIKMARFFWKTQGKPEKTKVISRQWGYHGTTLAAMSATGMDPYWLLFEPRVAGFIHIPSPYPYWYQAADGVSQGVAAANELETAILHEGPDTVAMFIAEPVQGGGGVIVPQDDYFGRIRQICDQYEILLVADEVITGFGRTGRMFALEHWGVEPDIVQFAKAITSGYFPLGGIGISDAISQALDDFGKPWMHSYTYSGHPVGCAVALATLGIIERDGLVEKARVLGEQMLRGLSERLSDHPHVGEVRGLGLMAAIELVRDRSTKTSFDAEDGVGAAVHAAAQEHGLFTRMRGDVICLAPAFVTGENELEQMMDITQQAIRAVLG